MKLRSKYFLAAWLVLFVPSSIHAFRFTPREFEELSKNKRFIVFIKREPPKDDVQMTVYKLEGSTRILAWQLTLTNQITEKVLLSDDGEHVVAEDHFDYAPDALSFYDHRGLVKRYSVNEIFPRRKRSEVITVPDSEQVLLDPNTGLPLFSSEGVSVDLNTGLPLPFPVPVPAGIDPFSSESFVVDPDTNPPGPTEVESFAENQTWTDQVHLSLLEQVENTTVFCLWLEGRSDWMSWDIASGAKVEVSSNKKRKWTEKTHRWALTTIRENEPDPLRDWIRAAKRRAGELLRTADKRTSEDWWLQYRMNEESLAYACRFLRKTNLPGDRKLVEKLLTATDFSTFTTYTPSVKEARAQGGQPTNFCFDVMSYQRSLADQILAEWDGRLDSNREHGRLLPFSHDDYFFLGKISGAVALACPPTGADGTLWIYLIPAKVSPGKWPNHPPIHRAWATVHEVAETFSWRVPAELLDLRKTETGYKLGTSMPFRFDGVTPGNYRLKAVWDKSYPFAGKDQIGVPGPGDYESGEEPSIEVVAGKSVENVTVVCTNLFKSK
jgi:hypothetical protein